MTWEYNPVENPDWDYARNLQAVLKTLSASWSQSVFSANHKGFLAPNRDYPYQGLTALVGEENWKFLDALYFNTPEELKAEKVLVDPWKTVYLYSPGVKISYNLFEQREGARARVEFESVKKTQWRIRPLVDLRVLPGYEDEENVEEDGWESKAKKNKLEVSNQGKKILFKAKAQTESFREPLEYNYKLGSGWREKTPQGIKFKSEQYNPIFAGELKSKSNKLTIDIICRGENSPGREKKIDDKLPELGFSLGEEHLNEALRARLYGLRKFDIPVEDIQAPSAGDYWFKKIYFRDTFEGLYNNIHVLTRDREGKDYVKNVLLLAISCQDRLTGRIPNIYPSSMSASDATFLFFMTAGEYLRTKEDKKLARKILESMTLFVEAMEKARPEVNGPPSLENSLVLSSPWHPWVDSRRSLFFEGKRVQLIPTRVPKQWLWEIYNKTKNPRRVYYESNSSDYLLPEVNAQWIKTLEYGRELCDLLGEDDRFGELREKALENYSVFMRNNFPLNIIRKEQEDDTLTSMGMVSLVLLKDHLSCPQAWKKVKKLLVYRKNKLFGILVKDSERQPYVDENEYHEAVVWPRDVPYLVRYLIEVKKSKLARELLLNHLDHQMGEGAIFYNHELFSLPLGKNPCPRSREPVPVKNPIQYWSQFIDPYTWIFS